METRKNTTAGVLFWTPAPGRTSPTSSVMSEDVWEDEGQAEKDADFFSQMDENGIIGLSEALEDVESGQSCCDSDTECNPNLYPGPLIPEDADLSMHDRDTPEELSEHLSHTQSPGEDVQILSAPVEDLMDRAEEQGIERIPEWDKHLDITEEEKDGEEAAKRSDRKRKKNKHTGTSREIGTMNGLAEISSTQSCSGHPLVMEPTRASSHLCPISQSASPATAPTLPHLLHFTAEEIAAAPGIDAETFPEMSFTESLPESHKSHISFKSSPRCPEVKLRTSLQPAAMFSEDVVSNHYSGTSNGSSTASDKSDKPHKITTSLPRKMKQLSPEATNSRTRSHNIAKPDSLKFKHQSASPDRGSRTPRARSSAAEVDESRKGPLSYHTPDFSKVEPKVRFPKGGYKPPKSRLSSKRESLSPEPPLVFKSPADIVKEVLLNTTDGSPASSDSYKPPTSAPNSTVPQEFRCRQQATTLLEQLQEDYNRLLTKYAEAENTIDRLRLEAKVNLYSDHPKPGYLVQSGPNQNTSNFMMLDFPQAQRAEISSASLHSNGHNTHQGSSSACPSTRSPDPQLGQQLAKILYSQADKFLQQLQTFEDLLKSKKLKPFEQMKGLSQLAEGLDSLERGYLLARDEHKLLQQRGAYISNFDPERELEGLIFQCGLRMDELKEQVEQMQQEQPTCEAPPSPPPHPTPLSVPSDGGETLTHPQSPPLPLLADPGEAVAVEVSSPSDESDEEEETQSSLYLKPLNGKHRHLEQDFGTLMDHYQSFKELPKLLDHSQREGAPLSVARKSDMQPGDEEEDRRGHGTGNLQVQKSLLQRKAKSDHQDSPPVCTSQQQTSSSSPPSHRAASQSTTTPVHPPSSKRRLEVGKSHSSSLSSLGEITASEMRNSKLQTGRGRVLSQDGIISPETDSGFVCSESSRLTPAAAPSPVHQRASEGVSVPQEGSSGKPQIHPVPTPSPVSSPSHGRMAMEPRRGLRLSHDQPRRTKHGQRRCTSSSSPQRCVRQSEQTRDTETNEFGLDSDSSFSVSEDSQNDQYTESINSLHNSSPSSSPAAQYHHGNSLRALSSSQAANRNEAIQTLQAEVTRLREKLESCLRNEKPLSSVRAAPSAQENYTHQNTSRPRGRSVEQSDDVSRGGRDGLMVEEVDYSTLRRTTRRASSAHRQKLQPDIYTSTPQPHPLVSRCTQTSTAAPLRSGELWGDVSRGGRDGLTVDEVDYSTLGRTTRRASSAHRHKPQPDILNGSDPSTPHPLVSRCTQTATAAPVSCCSHTDAVGSRTHPRQHPGTFAQVSQTADEPDSRGRRAPLCPQCLSRYRGRPEVGGDREPTHSSRCRHCLLCGRTEPYRKTETDCRRVSDSPPHTSCHSAESPDRAVRNRDFAAAASPALLQCMPMCPPPLLLYSSPFYVCPSKNTGASSGVRGREEVRGRKRRSLFAAEQRSTDTSLNRAIRAARHMKHTTGHMARSLATGLHYQELLAQSSS